MEILDVTINAASKRGKIGWFEGIVTYVEGSQMKKRHMDFPLSDLIELDVCKNLGAWNKVNEWANSDDGLAYIIKNWDRKDMMMEKGVLEVVWQLPLKHNNFTAYDSIHPNAKYHAFVNYQSLCGNYQQDTDYYETGIDESELMKNQKLACQRCLKIREKIKGV